MKLPVRKCYHAAKISFILILVVTLLSLFEHWRGGKRSTSAHTFNPGDDYEKQILEDEARVVPGLGEGGSPAYLFGEEKRLGEESEKKLAINVYLSDRIAYNRTLKDHRNPACQRVIYDAELPSASVILIFHNEPFSVVVRTIWSVLNSVRRNQPWYEKANFVNRETGKIMKMGYRDQDPSSEFVYLREIILVDDNSTLPELKGKLSHYVRTRLPPDLIKILRLPDRQGLMRARITGARAARGDVLVFLDAHCETNVDWLRPLLQRTRHKRDAVLTPVIDVVDQTTFKLEAAEQIQVGGFTFMGHFTWIDVPEREKKRRGSDISPTWSPTMAGGLFAINREYYWELGAYDEQMAGWGGENLEMSFRIWQCGGTLETIPCSRVGHVFRSFHPYGLPAHSDTHGINTARMAEVWMDDYAELFYLHRPDLRKSPKIGDVTHRKVLREKLKCKSFQWYLDNVYTEKFVPVRDVFGFGRFSNPASGLCLDTLQREGEGAALGAYPCHARLEPTQHLALSLRGELRDEERCADVQYARNTEIGEDVSRKVIMVTCSGKQRGQKWRYLPSQQLQHVGSGLCVVTSRAAGGDVTAGRCRRAPPQLWRIDYTETNHFRLSDEGEPSEQEMKLNKLRGQRRISRSLLSYPELNNTRRRKSKHKHRSNRKTKRYRKQKKNKFVLELMRNGTKGEEHLEVDIYCKHRRLFPNDTFVRDLVAILNEKNIRVINNGRVFEHNRVVELRGAHSLRTSTTTFSPLEPHPVKKRKHNKQKKILEPIINVHDSEITDNDFNVADNTEMAEEKMADIPNVESKKIIIEDFVAVTAKSTERPTKKKRKRNHGRKQKSTTKVPEWQDSLAAEEEPLVESGEPKNSGEMYNIVSSHSHHNTTKRLRSSHTGKDTSEEINEAVGSKPVKVVMKSNLTFNFGDEFFNWKTAGDVANLLGELIIPANITNAVARIQTDGGRDRERHTLRDRDGDNDSGHLKIKHIYVPKSTTSARETEDNRMNGERDGDNDDENFTLNAKHRNMSKSKTSAKETEDNNIKEETDRDNMIKEEVLDDSSDSSDNISE